jgi:hypothetical protein
MKKLPIALALSASFVLAGCGGGSSSGGGGATTAPSTAASPTSQPQATNAASKAAATADIKTTWSTFFLSGTPVSTAVGLLENGSTLGPAIKIAGRIAKKDKTKESAVVSKVTFTGPTNANVVYNLLGNGKPLLANADGKAVLQDGTWRVAQDTFCTLVGLGASTVGLKKIPGCQ